MRTDYFAVLICLWLTTGTATGDRKAVKRYFRQMLDFDEFAKVSRKYFEKVRNEKMPEKAPKIVSDEILDLGLFTPETENPAAEGDEVHGRGLLEVGQTFSRGKRKKKRKHFADEPPALLSVKGDFEAGLIHGAAVLRYNDTSTVLGTFVRGVLHGPFAEFNKRNMTFWIGGYEFGRRVGSWMQMAHKVAAHFNLEESPFNFSLIDMRSDDEDDNQCHPYMIHREGRLYPAKATSAGFDSNNGVLEVRFEPEEESRGLKVLNVSVPHNLQTLKPEEKREIAMFLFSSHCRHFSHEPLRSFVKNPLIYNQPEGWQDFNLTAYEDVDEECSWAAKLKLPPMNSVFNINYSRYPGSGSKWILDLLMVASGLYIYYNAGMLKEAKSRHLLLPTHHTRLENLEAVYEDKSFLRSPEYFNFGLRSVSYFNEDHKEAVVLLRNPYKAVISFWNHRSSANAFGPGLERADLEAELKSDAFCRFAVSEVPFWESSAVDWLRFAPDLLVLHFEHFREDFERELKKLAAYIKLELSEERLSCLRRYPTTKYKRAELRMPENPFCPQAVTMIEAAIVRVNEALRERGFDPLPTHLYQYHVDQSQVKEKEEL